MLKSKITNVSALQFFQLLRYSSLVLISVLLAKSSFTQINIGEYETLLFIAGGVSFFWLNSLIKSFLSSYKQTSDKSSEIFNFFILILGFSLIIFLILKFLIVSELTNLYSIKYVDLVIYYILLLGTSSIAEYILLVRKKTKTIFAYAIISYSIQVVLIGVSIFYFKSISYILYSLIAVSLLRNIYAFYLVSIYSELKFNLSFIKNNLKLSYPLMLSFVLSGSAQYIDGIIVKYKFDESTFAIFRYGTKEFPLLVILTDALSNALINEFNEDNLKTTLQKLRQKSSNITKFLFPVSIVLLLTSNYLFQYVFNKQFIESAIIFDIYLLLVISRLVFPQTVMLGMKNTKAIFSASLIEFVVNVVLSLVLVQYYGIAGVAIATVFAYLSEKIFLIFKTKQLYKITAKEYINVPQIVLFSLILIIVFILKYIYL